MNTNHIKNRTKESGLAVIEFTIVSIAFLFLFFAFFEVARFMYSLQMLNEATRIAARLATVCYVDDDIGSMNSIQSVVPEAFSEFELTITYLGTDDDGNEIVIDVSDPNNVSSIQFVRAQIDTTNTSYTFVNLLSHFSGSSLIPTYETTLPAENLGVLRYGNNPDTYTDCN